ncbi:MAG: hypothetical protein PHV34_19925 [Verrucomicrobiae bacterium]|nr:hypothetical protein [Verrucomicrobiae bacterium]
MKVLRFIWWLIIFLCLYATFFIFFQYKPSEFSQGAKEQLTMLKQTCGLVK